MQYWNRKNEPQSNPVDVEALRRFKVGNIIHEYMQSFFPQAQKEVKVEAGDDVIGFADIVLTDEVVDIKSCRSYEFKLLVKPDYDIEVGKTTNCLQVMSYALMLNKPQGRLIFIEKDALDSTEFVLQTRDWVEKIADELTILRGQWKKDELPAPNPRAYGGKECNYCNFRDKCFTMQGKPLIKEKGEK
jgi:CRISPR/Cas system-associated exonuclease Cas4 (RecB family)